ncbi:RNase A-like domain-containing protein [Kitasatospora aburaviensis]
MDRGRGWTLTSNLKAGDRLRGSDGALRTVRELRDRSGLAPQRVYDLTVDGDHTFFVRTEGDSSQDLLVHNCNDLVKDELAFPDVAHTLSTHVNPTPQQAIDHAAKNLREGKAPVCGVFLDQQTAQQVVDYAIAGKDQLNPRAINDWLSGRGPFAGRDMEIPGYFGKPGNSIGKVYGPNGLIGDAGNRYMVVLRKAPGHKPGGYIVLTAYPVL